MYHPTISLLVQPFAFLNNKLNDVCSNYSNEWLKFVSIDYDTEVMSKEMSDIETSKVIISVMNSDPDFDIFDLIDVMCDRNKGLTDRMLAIPELFSFSKEDLISGKNISNVDKELNSLYKNLFAHAVLNVPWKQNNITALSTDEMNEKRGKALDEFLIQFLSNTTNKMPDEEKLQYFNDLASQAMGVDFLTH